MTSDTESIRLRLTKELLKRARKRAKIEQRTTSSLIRFALVQYLDNQRRQDADRSNSQEVASSE